MHFSEELLHLCILVDLLQRTRDATSRSKGLTSDLSQVGGAAARVQDMLATMLTYIEDVLVSTTTWTRQTCFLVIIIIRDVKEEHVPNPKFIQTEGNQRSLPGLL